MKKSLIALLASLLSAGCVPEDDPAQEDEQEQVAQESGMPDITPFLITDSGIIVYWESDLKPEDQLLVYSRDDIETWWIEVQNCAGLEAEPTIVRIVDNVQSICPDLPEGSTAGYCVGQPGDPIVLHVSEAYALPIWATADDRRSWKHEFIHHILRMNNHPDDQNLAHEPQSMFDCQF